MGVKSQESPFGFLLKLPNPNTKKIDNVLTIIQGGGLQDEHCYE